MAWYDPRTWDNPFDGDDAGRERNNDLRQGLQSQGGKSGQFADVSQDRFGALGGEANALRRQLEEYASGRQSLSKEQLRQGLQQQMAQQRSMVAGAGPNAAMQARNAMNNMARASYGMSGQAAAAGIAERQAAQQALAQLLMQQRGQDLQAALGGRQTAIAGYGAGLNQNADQSWSQRNAPLLGALSGVAGLF